MAAAEALSVQSEDTLKRTETRLATNQIKLNESRAKKTQVDFDLRVAELKWRKAEERKRKAEEKAAQIAKVVPLITDIAMIPSKITVAELDAQLDRFRTSDLEVPLKSKRGNRAEKVGHLVAAITRYRAAVVNPA